MNMDRCKRPTRPRQIIDEVPKSMQRNRAVLEEKTIRFEIFQTCLKGRNCLVGQADLLPSEAVYTGVEQSASPPISGSKRNLHQTNEDKR